MPHPEPELACRPGCGACCIAISISSPLPSMTDGKAAGVRCLHLTPDIKCGIFGRADRPAVCASLMPMAEMCHDTREGAIAYLEWLETETNPLI